VFVPLDRGFAGAGIVVKLAVAGGKRPDAQIAVSLPKLNMQTANPAFGPNWRCHRGRSSSHSALASETYGPSRC